MSLYPYGAILHSWTFVAFWINQFCFSGPGIPIVADRERFLSSLSLGGSGLSPRQMPLSALMARYSWRTIAVVQDIMSNNPSSVRATETCHMILDILNTKRGYIQYTTITTDSSIEASPRKALLEASKFSRSNWFSMNVRHNYHGITKGILSFQFLTRKFNHHFCKYLDVVVFSCALSGPQRLLLVR